MKQVNYFNYGKSDVLKITDVPRPTLKSKKSILVKVLYSSLNAIDWKNREGDFRIFSGLLKPRTKQGFDVVGSVENKSDDVTEFNIGDKIIVQLGNFSGGALSEYLVADAKNAAKLNESISLEQAAGIPMAGTTAWLALLQDGKLKKGDKVLINGGSSGVGHLAIQIAKAYGAVVTSVSSSRNLFFCKELGADHAISYQEENFLELGEKFDIIFDVVFNASLKKVRPILNNNGIYIGTITSKTMIWEMLTSKQAKFVAVNPNKKALEDLLRLMQEGKLKVNIDKVFKMKDIAIAHDYMEKSRTRGKLIIDLDLN